MITTVLTMTICNYIYNHCGKKALMAGIFSNDSDASVSYHLHSKKKTLNGPYLRQTISAMKKWSPTA